MHLHTPIKGHERKIGIDHITRFLNPPSKSSIFLSFTKCQLDSHTDVKSLSKSSSLQNRIQQIIIAYYIFLNFNLDQYVEQNYLFFTHVNKKRTLYTKNRVCTHTTSTTLLRCCHLPHINKKKTEHLKIENLESNGCRQCQITVKVWMITPVQCM